MVSSAKKLAGMENSTFVPDALWEEWVERGVEDLWEKLLDVFGSEYFSKTDTITTSDGTEDYNLASDFFEMIHIYNNPDGKNMPLKKFEWASEPSLRNVSLTEKRKYYRIIGATTQSGTHQIKILPVPDGVETIYYRYAYKPVFASGTDTIDGINGWEEYAELIAAIKALNREESDPSGLVMDLQRVASRIDRHKASRDRANPAKISDTRRDRWRRYRGRYIDDIV